MHYAWLKVFIFLICRRRRACTEHCNI